MKRREAKSKGEKERYTHLNSEFQRTARRDKKAFLSDQWKEVEERNRIEKTRDLFKKIRDTKGIFHAKMDTIKDRNRMGLTEAEDLNLRRLTIPSVREGLEELKVSLSAKNLKRYCHLRIYFGSFLKS